MTKKTLAMSLIIFPILPVISLAGEIEIGDAKLEWREDFATAWTFWTKIPVTNYANHEYRVIGKLLFSDENGVELYGIPFWGIEEKIKGSSLKYLTIERNYVKCRRSDDAREPQGFCTILATESDHPPHGKLTVALGIACEHTLFHTLADFLMATETDREFHPGFDDGPRCQIVIDVVLKWFISLHKIQKEKSI